MRIQTSVEIHIIKPETANSDRCYCTRNLKKKDGDLFRINGFLISVYNSITDICSGLYL